MKKILLTQGKCAIVDDADYEWLNQWKWCIQPNHGTIYVIRNERRKGRRVTVRMHREILGIEHGDKAQVDHIDGNGINNQRHNLRKCSHQQNSFNKKKRKKTTSQYHGVHQFRNTVNRKTYKYWRAAIRVNGKPIFLGQFPTELLAAKAYDKAAEKYFGEFANLNIYRRFK